MTNYQLRRICETAIPCPCFHPFPPSFHTYKQTKDARDVQERLSVFNEEAKCAPGDLVMMRDEAGAPSAERRAPLDGEVC